MNEKTLQFSHVSSAHVARERARQRKARKIIRHLHGELCLQCDDARAQRLYLRVDLRICQRTYHRGDER